MPSPDSEGRSLATPEFWNSRYEVPSSDGETPTHEWFRSFEALKPFFEKHLPPPSKENGVRILHLGSGDSTVPAELVRMGYEGQVCVDFSEVVVEKMKQKSEGVEWRCEDVRRLPGEWEGEFDVAFDKGTMDAMIWGSPWSPPEEVRGNTGEYVREVWRVLKPGGRFLYVTYRQTHFMRPLLVGRGCEWDGVEVESLGDGTGLGYFGWVLRKGER